VSSQGAPTYTVFADQNLVNGKPCEVYPTCVVLGLDPNSGSCAEFASVDYCENNCNHGYGSNSQCGGFVIASNGECYYMTTVDVSQCETYSAPGNTLYRKNLVCDPGTFCSTSQTAGYCPWISWNVPGCITFSDSATASATATSTSSSSISATPTSSSSSTSSGYSSFSALASLSVSLSCQPSPSLNVSVAPSSSFSPSSSYSQRLLLIGGGIGGGASIIIFGSGLMLWFFCIRAKPIRAGSAESSPLLQFSASGEVSFHNDKSLAMVPTRE